MFKNIHLITFVNTEAFLLERLVKTKQNFKETKQKQFKFKLSPDHLGLFFFFFTKVMALGQKVSLTLVHKPGVKSTAHSK